MSSLRKRLHTGVLLGMIPLAVFSGIPATACYCANGHLKLVCGGHDAASKVRPCKGEPALAGPSTRSNCCGPGHDAEDAATAAADCCHSGHGSPPPCGKCCKQISKLLTTTVASATLPAIDLQAFAVLPAELVVSHACLSLRNAQLERVDTGPPIDLVITLRTLLI